MKFSVQNIQCAPRLGVLSQVADKPDIKLETPMAILHTQGGHIPHITHEVFKLVSQEPQILQIPLVTMHNYQEAIRLYNGRVSDFIGNKNSLTYITLHDPSNLTKQGHHVKGKVPIFTRNGKILYDSKMYMDMLENLKPDMYVLLSDSDTNIASPNKRITKAVENTVTFSQQCIELYKKSDVLKDTFVLAPLAGGYNLKSRQKCYELMSVNDLYYQGYLIDGLHNNGPEVEFIPYAEVKPIVEGVIKLLPLDKLRVVQGCWSPLNILNFIKSGVDLFDTSYCRIVTERSAALSFAIDPEEVTEAYEINLRQSDYADDFQPIMRECKCVACIGYSRGYIHHLLTVQELLGSVLIMVHNVHHMLRFFHKIRESIKNNNLDELEDRVSSQYKLFEIQNNNLNVENFSGN